MCVSPSFTSSSSSILYSVRYFLRSFLFFNFQVNHKTPKKCARCADMACVRFSFCQPSKSFPIYNEIMTLMRINLVTFASNKRAQNYLLNRFFGRQVTREHSSTIEINGEEEKNGAFFSYGSSSLRQVARGRNANN